MLNITSTQIHYLHAMGVTVWRRRNIASSVLHPDVASSVSISNPAPVAIEPVARLSTTTASSPTTQSSIHFYQLPLLSGNALFIAAVDVASWQAAEQTLFEAMCRALKGAAAPSRLAACPAKLDLCYGNPANSLQLSPRVVTHSVAAIAANPALKRETWTAMQVLIT